MSKPSWRERLRPTELLGLAGVMAAFTAGVVLMSTRDIIIAVIALGIAFVVALVVLAMLALAADPSRDEILDLDEQDRGSH